MPELETKPTGSTEGKPNGGSAPAADPKNTEQQGGGDDDRLSLRERAITAERELAKFREAQKKADDARLAEQGKHQERAAKFEADANGWKAKYTEAQRNNALIAAGAKAGINDASDLVLAKLGDVDVDDAEALGAAATKAVADLQKAKPYLFGGSANPNPKPNAAQTKAAPAGGRSFDPSRKYTDEEVRAMSPADFNAYYAAKYGKQVDPWGQPKS